VQTDVSHNRDLSSPVLWRRSLRASHERRVKRARKRRRAFRGRAGVILAVALSTVAAGGAFAQDAATPQATSAQNPATVRAVQQKLGVTADGVYGPRTRAAVKRFQRRSGLTVDGVVGPQTLAALGLAAPQPSSTADETSDEAGSGGSGASSGSADATLARIAQCESGGDPTAISADGTYRGKYQFDRETWQQMGGTGDPAEAPEAEQDRIAAKLLAARGTAPWPKCGANA
jgi:peptidoglycan hydrolase-like protein with peptidoglycan-binding domain